MLTVRRPQVGKGLRPAHPRRPGRRAVAALPPAPCLASDSPTRRRPRHPCVKRCDLVSHCRIEPFLESSGAAARRRVRRSPRRALALGGPARRARAVPPKAAPADLPGSLCRHPGLQAAIFLSTPMSRSRLPRALPAATSHSTAFANLDLASTRRGLTATISVKTALITRTTGRSQTVSTLTEPVFNLQLIGS
jgi:hypothetical protein